MTLTPAVATVLLLRLLALVLFGIAMWQPSSSNPDRLRLVASGLTALTASLITW